ncbi:MAG: PaaX family transcriptional regulator C-terminal domain-containing protein [Actinomycetota bacterium]
MAMTTSSALSTPTRTFIYGLADDNGHVDTEFLYAAADVAGFSSTKLRLALKRMVDAGLASSNGRGRKAVTQLTAAGLADRSPELAWVGAAYRADAGLDPWDGIWHLASFEIPERQRAARDAVRTQIVELFGGQLSGGLYVSPLGWEPWILAVAAEHDVVDRITLIKTTSLTHAGTSDQAQIAAHVWPVQDVHEGYTAFVTRWRSEIDSLPSDPLDAVRVAFDAAYEFEATFRRDPMLPSAVAPEHFAGPAARQLFLEMLDALRAHPELADASLFTAYRNTVDRALAMKQPDFWSAAFADTINAPA